MASHQLVCNLPIRDFTNSIACTKRTSHREFARMPSAPVSPPQFRGIRQVDPPKASNIELPTQYDQRTLFPNSVSIKTVLDQGNCGSCWAFGSSSTLSDRLFRANNTTNIIISPQQVVDCSRNCYALGFGCNSGCNGGSADFRLLARFSHKG